MNPPRRHDNFASPTRPPPPAAAAPSYPFAARARDLKRSEIREFLRHAGAPGMISLAGGLPAAELFDRDGLAAASAAVLRERPAAALQYGMTEGQPRLREALTALMGERGINAAANATAGTSAAARDGLLVTTGSQQAIDLLARIFIEPGDTVVVERPCYLAAVQAFALAGARLRTLPTDADGACVERLDDCLGDDGGPPPKFIYLVSTFANPTGATLSRERRLALLRWAVRHRVLVIEDDPYGELRFAGDAVPPLLALAAEVPGAADWCGYLSSLSKIVAPGLRVGWMQLPPAIAEQAGRVKQTLDLHTSSLAQEIAAAYLASGRLPAVLARARERYRTQAEALADALQRRFGERLQFALPEGGMFLWARFVDGTDSGALLPAALAQSVIYVPGAAFYADAPDCATLRLSYAGIPPEQAGEAAARLLRAVASAASTGSAARR